VRLGRRPEKLTDYRSMLARRGDVEFGAYARQRWRRNALGVLFGLVLIGGASWLYIELRPHEEALAHRREFGDKVRCSVCNHEAIVPVNTHEKFPLTCPKCKARSCWKVWRCHDCGTEFITKDAQEGPRQAATTIRCPNCGSMVVGAAPETPAGAPPPRP
jgi:predicted Zn finger-like uncharacterized protein